MNEKGEANESTFQKAPKIVSMIQRKGEGAVVWELINWSDADKFESLMLHANCEVAVNENVSFRFFLKDEKKVVTISDKRTETESLSLCVRELLTNLKVNEKSYRDAGFTLKVVVGFLNNDFLHQHYKPQGYKSDFESGIIVDFKSGRNLTEERVVMEEFIVLCQATTHNPGLFGGTGAAPPNSIPLIIKHKRPDNLRYGITVELFSCNGQSSSSSPLIPTRSELESELPIFKDFERMYAQEDNYSDLKLESRDGGLINVHKFVLAARSSKFGALIEKETKRNDFSGTIKIGDMSAKSVTAIVNWMYTGKLDEKQDDKILEQLIISCEKYELKDLHKLCEKTLIRLCNLGNMLSLFQLAKKHRLHDATKEISLFIKENIVEAI